MNRHGYEGFEVDLYQKGHEESPSCVVKGVCFSAALGQVSLKRGDITKARFSILPSSQPLTYWSKRTPPGPVSRDQVVLWIRVGRALFGWNFSITDVIKNPEPPPITISGDTPLLKAFFEVCWFRLLFEHGAAFARLAQSLRKLPPENQLPWTPGFWLSYMYASYTFEKITVHDIIPGNDSFGSWVELGTGRSSGAYRNALNAIAAAEFSKKIFEKTGTTPCLSLSEAILQRSTRDPGLFREILNQTPVVVRRPIAVKWSHLNDPYVVAVVNKGFTFINKTLQLKNPRPFSSSGTRGGAVYFLTPDRARQYTQWERAQKKARAGSPFLYSRRSTYPPTRR